MNQKKLMGDRLLQGDVIRDAELIEAIRETDGNLEVQKIIFPLVVVLTQDCDLEQEDRFRGADDKNQDKLLLSVLVAPLYNAEHVYEGTQLKDIEMDMSTINRKRSPGIALRNNETPRYHYLEFPDTIQVVPSVVDFKHYFSVNGEYLRLQKHTHHACSLNELFREDLSNRFANYLSRIGLPEASASARTRAA